MTSKKNKMPGKRWTGLAVWLVAAVALVSAVAGVSAKYAHTETKVDDTLSSDFYFTSTLLSEAGTQYTLMPETNSLEIPLCNYADSLRISNADITYSYTVTKDGGSETTGNGTIVAGAANTQTISLTDLTKGTYTVTAVATSPYQATLKGTFTIPTESTGVHYSVTDTSGSPYVLLTVWTENYSGKVTLTWPAGLIPDSTNPALSGASTYSVSGYTAGSIVVSGAPYGSNVYRFFKQNTSAVFTMANFTATAANG